MSKRLFLAGFLYLVLSLSLYYISVFEPRIVRGLVDGLAQYPGYLVGGTLNAISQTPWLGIAAMLAALR